MKLKTLMIEDSNMKVNEKMRKIKLDSISNKRTKLNQDKNERQFFRNEVLDALRQIKGRIK
jgi:hypothetical protein